MKRKFLLFLLIAVSSTQIVKAQIPKGTIFLGGQVGFGIGKTDSENSIPDSRQTNYSFAPAIGVFVKNNLVWGGDVYVNGYRYNYESIPDQKQFSTGLGVFVRQYLPVLDRLYLFGQGRFNAGYLSENSFNGSTNVKGKGYNVSIGISPGISFALKKNIHLESSFAGLASISFSHIKRTYDDLPGAVSKSNSFSIGGNLNNAAEFTIGIRFLLEK